MEHSKLDFQSVRRLLVETDPDALEALYAAAHALRVESLGQATLLRGLVEISNHCPRSCLYCGLRAATPIARYRLSNATILDCARSVAEARIDTVVLQAGEDPALTRGLVAGLIRRIKGECGLKVTLSLGERGFDDYAAWRSAGADRVLLRFETSDPSHFARIHPPRGKPYDRIAALGRLREMGFEIGSGLLFGLPGQSADSLARDLLLLGDLDLDMIGSGPYIPHPQTPLARLAPSTEVPPVPETTFRVIALTRLLAPRANIPATTALAALGGEKARQQALSRGANVLMPIFTPRAYRGLYEIYRGRVWPRDVPTT